jgi:hypothetical protein
MAILYSFWVKPNWDTGYGPTWTDLTDTLITDQLPSISVGAERADIPLVTVVSDMSLTVNNADNRWDAIFDVAKIIGVLPPVSGTIRAPLVHYGAVLFCRKASEQPQWEVVFVGFIDPSSVIFNRMEKQLTLTAYAPGKLLDLGNAERVNRISAFFPSVPARPFVIPLQLVHPAVAPGTPALPSPQPTDDSWWKLVNGAQVPMLIGDEFGVVQSISTWIENMALTDMGSGTFKVIQVKPLGLDLYFQTAEAPADLLLGGAVANLNHLTPWYVGASWEFLVGQLISVLPAREANAAIAALGAPDLLTVNLTNLPLLPTNANQITAQPIYSADAPPTITGVTMLKAGPAAPPGLGYTQETSSTAPGKIAEKVDILAPDTIAGSTPVFVGPMIDPDILGSPDDGQTARVPSAELSMAGHVLDFVTDDVVSCGKDLHAFFLGTYFDSTNWFRTPTSFFAGPGTPKRFYRIYSFGVFSQPPPASEQGIIISEYVTSDSGGTWTLNSEVTVATFGANPTVQPSTSRSSRPCFKVYWLAAGSFLYCWTNPHRSSAYFKTSPNDSQPASYFSPAPTPFIGPSAGAPMLSSGFVTETVNGIGGNVFFFCNRRDGTAVDFYYWNGAAFVLGSIVNASGVSLTLFGGDFINAVIDRQFPAPPNVMYVMNGANLLVLTYTFSAGTFTITKAQIVPIDTPNYDPQAEAVATIASNMGALAWIAGKVVQNNPGEPNYGAQPFSMIVGTMQKIYIVSSTPSSIVDYADFEQLSVAGALQQLILVRGYQMFTGADQDFVANPATYTPIPTVSFKQRLIANPAPIDVTALTEACQDGLWILNYSSCKVTNSKDAPLLAPVYNHQTLTNLAGNTYTLKPPRYAGSSALEIDNRFITTASFAQLIADYFAQDFVLPQLAATIVMKDPYTLGLGYVLHLLDVLTYLVRAPDSLSGVPLTKRGRVFTIDYQLDLGLLTVSMK